MGNKRTRNKAKKQGKKNKLKNTNFDNELPEKNKVKAFVPIYKEATNQFLNELFALVPKNVIKGDASVHVIEKAADYVSSKCLNVSQRIMNNLKKSIIFRKKTSCLYPPEADDGSHRYFIDVLSYCWSVLRKQKSSEAIGTAKRKDDEQFNEALPNKFAALTVEEESDDEEDYLPDVTLPAVKPVLPKKMNDPPTLDELINGTMRFKVLLLLSSINEMLEIVSKQYKLLKMKCFEFDKEPEKVIIEVLKATHTCISCIKETRRLENQLVFEIPWLNTVYRQIVAVDFLDLVTELYKDINNFSPIKDQFNEKTAIMFLGDILGANFRRKLNESFVTDLIRDFQTKWKIPMKRLKLYTEYVHLAYKSIGETEETVKKWEASNESNLPVNLRSILNFLPYIGGYEYSLLNNVKLSELPYFNGGELWDDDRRRATTVSTVYKNFYIQEALPLIFKIATMCEWNETNNLFFKIIFEHAQKPLEDNGAFNWTYGLAVHCLIIGVYEVHGNGHVRKLGCLMKTVHNRYYDQIDLALKNVSQSLHNITWKNNLNQMLQTKMLTQIWTYIGAGRFNSFNELNALWNPFVGGNYLLLLCMNYSLDGGMHQLDSSGQFSLTLHLYNALKEIGLLIDTDIPLLEWLHSTFKNVTSLWHGGFPKRGVFHKTWLLNKGRSVTSMQKSLFERCPCCYPNHKDEEFELSNVRNHFLRTLPTAYTRFISKSFKRAYLKDFSGDDVDLTDASPIRELKQRLANTLKAFDEEKKLLSINYTSLADILNVFVKKLFKHLGLDTLVETFLDSINISKTKNTGWERPRDAYYDFYKNVVFGKCILSVLDLHDISKGYPADGVKASVFMKEYFSLINASDYTIFTT